jgi:hypothetical protein
MDIINLIEEFNVKTNIIDSKQKIIEIFRTKVKDKVIEYDKKINKNHDGKEGHWLEKQMCIKLNNYNLPDLFGYEMKKDSNKISFGDWSASEYAFSNHKETIDNFNNWQNIKIERSEFIHYFGNENINKNNRFSWSGVCFPKYGKINDYGQKIIFSKNNDLCIIYYFLKDKREKKNNFPDYLKKDKLLIAFWSSEKLKKSVEDKFNVNGYFICKKNKNTNKYDKICFGPKIDFVFFVEKIKNGEIILDSGMYDGNTRNYSIFRSSKKLWMDNIIEEF